MNSEWTDDVAMCKKTFASSNFPFVVTLPWATHMFLDLPDFWCSTLLLS